MSAETNRQIHLEIAHVLFMDIVGFSKLLMTELKAMCAAEGFTKIQCYITSGNVIFSAKQPEFKIKAALEKRLQAYNGKPVLVVVRTADEMSAVFESDPFPKSPPNSTVAIFLNDAPPAFRNRDVA